MRVVSEVKRVFKCSYTNLEEVRAGVTPTKLMFRHVAAIELKNYHQW